VPPRRSTFRTRLDRLADLVGDGDLVGRYVVNQRYAAYQHVHEGLNHPGGGGPNYVSAPLRARHKAWYRHIAAGLLSGQAPARMAEAMEDLDSQVTRLAPVDLGVLRQSGAVAVLSGGRPVYSRPARVPRLPR
jgi:hypothetical protein